MKPAATDPFPPGIEIRRGRRRTVELSLENGRFVARVPLRARESAIEGTLQSLRARLVQRMRRETVFDASTLQECARNVARRHLADLVLPPYSVEFSRRQRKRWGSCSFDGRRGRIRISALLIGHPRWLIENLLLHELIHLKVFDHGPAFQRLMQRDPRNERALGYLEALEHGDRLGVPAARRLAADIPLEAGADEKGDPHPRIAQPGLFETSADG